jgi:hypothetical protein
MAFQFFISYARDDDKAPPFAEGGKGFVSSLRDQLTFEFTDRGGIVPQMWWDRRNVEPHDQFDPVIQEGIQSSDLLMIVLSRNWLASDWCRRELELFRQHWNRETESSLRQRIWVVSKQYIDPDRRPALLQGQSSYEFFWREKTTPEGEEQEYFRQGKPQTGYDEVMKTLAVHLWKRAQTSGSIKKKEPIEPEPREQHSEPAATAKSPSRRVIYVAKPARDMRWAYLRVVDELQGRNYAVLPGRDENVPLEGAAEFVDAALGEAEASVHLLGEELGGSPEGCPPIVTLQLARAGARVPSNGETEGRGFRRIVWAPKVLVDENGTAADAERDPLAVLAKCGQQLPTDKVEGSELSAFIDFLTQHLERIWHPAIKQIDKQIAPGASVYVYFSEKDFEYASECIDALQEKQIYTDIPAFDKSEPALTRAVNRKKLRDCDAVMLCWAQAPDNWVDSKEDELKDLAKIGRSKPFALRALVAGPPPGFPKKARVKRARSNAIDVALDLTEYAALPPEALDPLIDKARAAESAS